MKAHSFTALKEGYKEIYSVYLQKNKKLALIINLIAIALGIVMGVLAHLKVPIYTLFTFEYGMIAYCARFGTLIVGSIAYIIVHELVHAAVMKIYGAKKVILGFTGMYAFAGSKEDYFDKFSYIQIALAPLVILGLILLIINLLVSTEWFWVVYAIQISNVAGAAGDMFVSCKFATFPKDILVKDTGVSMTVYSEK